MLLLPQLFQALVLLELLLELVLLLQLQQSLLVRLLLLFLQLLLGLHTLHVDALHFKLLHSLYLLMLVGYCGSEREKEGEG